MRGLQEVWLDRVTGRVCMSISAKAMSITGIDDRRYWTWVPTEESRLGFQNLQFTLNYVVVMLGQVICGIAFSLHEMNVIWELRAC